MVLLHEDDGSIGINLPPDTASREADSSSGADLQSQSRGLSNGSGVEGVLMSSSSSGVSVVVRGSSSAIAAPKGITDM